MDQKRGVVFGVFDHFHSGHKWFLQEAHKRCSQLFIVVALDEDVRYRKHHSPDDAIEVRKRAIKKYMPDAVVLDGDSTEGQWSVFKQQTINVCIVGYDQSQLRSRLEDVRQEWGMPFDIIQLNSFHPDQFKSSLHSSSVCNK